MFLQKKLVIQGKTIAMHYSNPRPKFEDWLCYKVSGICGFIGGDVWGGYQDVAERSILSVKLSGFVVWPVQLPSKTKMLPLWGSQDR